MALHCSNRLQIRGAPALASLAALSLSLSLAQAAAQAPAPPFLDSPAALLAHVEQAAAFLNSARPTAVNLGEAMRRMVAVGQAAAGRGDAVRAIVDAVVKAGREVQDEDLARNVRMSQLGADWIARTTGKTGDVRVLTVCNTGSLATSGMGTALGVITNLHKTGRLGRAFYTQTAPYHQGSRLTSLELLTLQIPSTLLADTMVGSLFQHHQVDALVVGADRVAANGDTANKVGTYNAAVLAKRHGVKVVIVAPETTVDLDTADGSLCVVSVSRRGPRCCALLPARG